MAARRALSYKEMAENAGRLGHEISRERIQQAMADMDRQEADACEEDFSYFVKCFWHVVEPGRTLVWDWPMQAICDHLQAVTEGRIKRLLINVPPGMMKSLLVNVFWPAWEWGPRRLSNTRYVCVSYAQHLTVRDNDRFKMVVRSRRYRRMFGSAFKLTKAAEIKVANDNTGWKLATSTEGVGTGERGDRVLIDDPHNVKDGESELRRNRTIRWMQETLPTRMNDFEKSVIVVIMQRVHANDASGEIIDKEMPYVHLCLPMHYDSKRHCSTWCDDQDPETDEPFFTDPREEEGELLCPDRYSPNALKEMAKSMSSYARAAQFEQSPSPRGGGIIKNKWWEVFPRLGEESIYMEKIKAINPDTGEAEVREAMRFPDFDFVLAYADTAYTEKEQNDDSALVILGVWHNAAGLPKIMLMDAWCGKLEFGQLIRRVISTCRKWRVDRLVIEGKASGISAAQEIEKVVKAEFAVETDEPKGDKTARAHSVAHLFEDGMIYAPDREFANKTVYATGDFPTGKNKDLADACIGGVKWLRMSGWALRKLEAEKEIAQESLPTAELESQEAVYDV